MIKILMFLSRLLPTVTRAPLWTHLWDHSASEVWLESADLSSGSGSSLESSSCSSSEASSAASVVDSANAFTSNIRSTKSSLLCFDVELLNILWYNWYLITQSYNLDSDSLIIVSVACAVVAETRATLPPTLMVDILAPTQHKQFSQRS